MTPRTFQNKLKGYNKAKESDYYFQRHLSWLHLKSQGAKIKPEDIWPLSLDEHTQIQSEIPTKEETEAVIAAYKKANPKLFRPKKPN